MVFLHFGSLSLYFITATKVAHGLNRVNPIDVIAAFLKEPRQIARCKNLEQGPNNLHTKFKRI